MKRRKRVPLPRRRRRTTSRTIRLRTPVTYMRERWDRLTFRPLVAADFVVAGYPFTVDAHGAVTVDADRLSTLIGLLADVRPGVVARLSSADWHAAMTIIVGDAT